MRANGIPDFPDPTGGGLSIQVHPGSDLNPNNPTFQNASKLCAKKTGVPGFGGGTPQPGPIEATSGGGPQGGPGGNGGAGHQVGVGSPVAEFSARRVGVIAAVAGALVGGAVAGGVAAASASGSHDAAASSSGGGSARWPRRRWCAPTWPRRCRWAGRSATTAPTRSSSRPGRPPSRSPRPSSS